MSITGRTPAGRFCWLDLAATDAGRSRDFYGALFGWGASEHAVNGGSYLRLHLDGEDVASMYQLKQIYLERGVPSHWTPYVRVQDVDQAAQRTAALGGKVIVNPFQLDGIARMALILDSSGAHMGLMQPLEQASRG